jgi:hypothetical protein
VIHRVAPTSDSKSRSRKRKKQDDEYEEPDAEVSPKERMTERRSTRASFPPIMQNPTCNNCGQTSSHTLVFPRLLQLPSDYDRDMNEANVPLLLSPAMTCLFPPTSSLPSAQLEKQHGNLGCCKMHPSTFSSKRHGSFCSWKPRLHISTSLPTRIVYLQRCHVYTRTSLRRLFSAAGKKFLTSND